MPKRYVMLSKTDTKANNNKFYEITMEDDGTVRARWGRVGAEGQSMVKGNGDRAFDSLERSKCSDGYKKVDVAVQNESSPNAPVSLREAAKRDLMGGNSAQTEAVVALIERLVRINAHQLTAVSGGRINIINGQVRTPLGLVTLESVQDARALLLQIEALVGKGRLDRQYQDLLENYLNRVPQKIPAKGGWDSTFFTGFTTFTRQYDLLDQLESSVKLEQSRAVALDPAAAAKEPEKLFHYQIELDPDTKQFKRINEFFRKTQNRMHASSKLQLKRIFSVRHPVADPAFDVLEKKIGNVQTLWHGTRAHNILSIFKSGLIIPPMHGSGISIAGRLFGNGLYFSDQSTKSLNYSYGYWDRGSADNNCFMFLCDVAMGKVYQATQGGDGRRPGHDSCLAVPGIPMGNGHRLQNNEMIVYRTEQARLRYLCEFDA